MLESVAACDPASTDADLKMYFVASTAFLNYFDDLIDTLKSPDLQYITIQEHVLPTSLEPLKFDEELLAAPKTFRGLLESYKKKKLKFNKQETG